jgi:mRNA interferase RelE/StbE
MYKVILAKIAKEFYDESEISDTKKINKAVEYLKINPRIHPNIKPLKGSLSGMWRYRAGALRIMYSIDDANRIVNVAEIDYRGNIYG